jgi:hypothetical protein
VSIQTRQDTAVEGNEVFRVRASEGQGCQVNPNFEYGDPASVIIKDDDKQAVTQPPATVAPTATTTIIPATTRTPEASPTPTGSVTPTPSESPSPTPTLTATPVEVSEDGGFPWLPVVAVIGFLAAGGGALILTRMRGLPS